MHSPSRLLGILAKSFVNARGAYDACASMSGISCHESCPEAVRICRTHLLGVALNLPFCGVEVVYHPSKCRVTSA